MTQRFVNLYYNCINGTSGLVQFLASRASTTLYSAFGKNVRHVNSLFDMNVNLSSKREAICKLEQNYNLSVHVGEVENACIIKEK